MQAMFRAAADGRPDAAREIADRIEGKAQQSVDLKHHRDQFADRTTEELRYFVKHGQWPPSEKPQDEKNSRVK